MKQLLLFFVKPGSGGLKRPRLLHWHGLFQGLLPSQALNPKALESLIALSCMLARLAETVTLDRMSPVAGYYLIGILLLIE